MDFLELAKTRYSARGYDGTAVEDVSLKKILEAGRVAPTAENAQPQRIVVVNTQDGMEKLKKAYPNTYGAPLALICCADHAETWKRPSDGMDSAYIDVSIVTTQMMLQATELGLGTIWLCAFDPDAVRAEFKLPGGIEPVNILLIGHANCRPRPADRHDKYRKPLDETVFYGSF